MRIYPISFSLMASLPMPLMAQEIEQTESTASDSVRPRTLPSQKTPDYTIPTLHSLGLMTTMRLSEAYLWPEPFAQTRLSVIGHHYKEAYTLPPLFDTSKPFMEWDGDKWYVNTIGHGLFGSEMYLRARTCHHSIPVSLGAAAAGSTLWEYGFEASGVRPSGLDLVYTPLSGLIIGEGRFQLWNAAKKSDSGFIRHVIPVLMDPLGEFERTLGSGC